MQQIPPHPGNGGAGPAGELLRLLRADAGPDRYAALLDHCAPADRSWLAPLVDDALQVRARLEEQSRHETELAALYETAGDLSSLRDLEAVLRAIVHRARALLGTDVAYLMLNNDRRGDTYMRVTDGIRTDAFKHNSLPLGSGLGGLVAKHAVPYHTADYFEDTRFEHVRDDVVRAEGLISVQGVPLVRGEQVIGVLFAANRRSRPFADHEVALLVSLANHAAIAIENATLFQDVRRAVDELTRANTVIQAHSASIERAAALHERLIGIVLDGAGLPVVAATLADVLGGSILVLDARRSTLAAAGPDPLVDQARAAGALPEDSPAAQAAREAGVPSAEARRTRWVPAGDGGPAACATPIVAGGEAMGVLLLVRDEPEAADIHALESAALVTALMFLSERAVAEAEHRLHGELLEDLLGNPHRDTEGLRRRATLMGITLSRPHTVLAARCGGPHRRQAADAAASYAARAGGLAGEYRGDVVVLVPADSAPADVARTLAEQLTHSVGVPVTVGAAAAGGGARSVIEAHRDASRCLDVLLALDREGEGATSDELGIYGLLFHQTGRDELHRFVGRTIGPVLDHDARRGGELAHTLMTYFANDANFTRTAAALYIHINTLYQRVERITALLGPQWRHADQILQVHLALKVYAVLGAP
ncbi:helix-turn-helix domain-containing protein [Streptomyces sp. NPDC057302]|uniref:helix-turn-helix domain-containing protein n=1 Tax=Streptomyces sp. NPDC057302 TaxID=3346094 RepID=UPI003631290E